MTDQTVNRAERLGHEITLADFTPIMLVLAAPVLLFGLIAAVM